ncbi:glycerophosphodiester phosphodiesterase family protein [Parasulfitobacter algicola]|uniref:Phosphodiesterase n=1 Tax=Parasulfitobacter algicola TaxID=2614809 RepID=A0ABX2INI3_9RHOB|nr:glycerophosphodiester phosphodiesterase family protein [Sulfitobacter algicola]NSX54423.1 phosphodiesterase [Sulfitobacter algicola]
MMLPKAFLDRPIAHRALHDRSAERPENTRAAMQVAVDAGYGIEIDVQLSADNHAIVFHDYVLDRLTHHIGPVRNRPLKDLQNIQLRNSDETIPDLPEVLEIVQGKVPLLVEIKDQDGLLGDKIGPLENAVTQALDGYHGDVAVMGFNPHSILRMSKLAPDIPRGLVTCDFKSEDWPGVSTDRRTELATIGDFHRVGASFISHAVNDLASSQVAALKTKSIPILCWTIRSPEQEAEARKIADNITFEGYLA